MKDYIGVFRGILGVARVAQMVSRGSGTES